MLYPQGTVLGPLLFSLYINDIPVGIDSHVSLFADDCLCYREGTILENVKVFWYPKLVCTSNSRAFKTKHFDINLMKIGGQIRKLWVIKYEIWTAAILFSS